MQKDSIPFYALLLGLGCLAVLGTNTLALGLPDMPPAVQKTIGSNSAGRTVSTIERKDDDGAVTYEVETTAKDGEEWELTVAEDGTLLSIEIPPAELPVAVQTAVTSQLGQGKMEGVEKLLDDGQTTYQVGIAAPSGDERDFTFGEDGTLISEEVNLAELTPDLQTAITTLVGKGALEGIDKTFDHNETTYEATMTTPAGQERNFTLSETGTLLSEEVSLAELPPKIQTAIKAQVGKGKLEGIDETFDGAGIAYEATMTAPDGKEGNVTISALGNLLSQEVNLADVPPEVQTAINAEVGQGKLEGIDKTFSLGKITYAATRTTPDGQERDFVISQQGDLLSHEVSLEEVPTTVQDTINQTISDGKILEIDQVFRIARHTVVYKIEGQKDGKPVTFSIGPRGNVSAVEDEE
jgi:hypothetical protein